MYLPAVRARAIGGAVVLCLLAAGLAAMAPVAAADGESTRNVRSAQFDQRSHTADADRVTFWIGGSGQSTPPFQIGGSEQSEPPLQTGDVEPDRTIIRADIEEDGDATWTAEYVLDLEDEKREQAFEELAADIEANASGYAARFESRASRVVDAAADATGRPMRIENVSVAVSTDLQNAGTVEYRYTWTNFAARTDGELRIGAAISGFYLEPSSRLIVSWPEGYDLETVAPPAADTDEDANRVQWRGERAFGPGEPTVVVSSSSGGMARSTLLAGAVVLLAVLGSVVLARSSLLDTRALLGDDVETEAESDGTEPAAEPEDAAPPESAAGGSSNPELAALTSDERVLALLEREGGRMKQQAVTAELDWSAARTSQVVSELTESDRVEVYRVGRENVLKLPEEGQNDV